MQTAVITSRPRGCHRVAFAPNAAAASAAVPELPLTQVL
jgi:hypothetical protein